MTETAFDITNTQIKSWGLSGYEDFSEYGKIRGLTIKASEIDARLKPFGSRFSDIFLIACDSFIIDCDLTISQPLWIFSRHVQVNGGRCLAIEPGAPVANPKERANFLMLFCHSLGGSGSLSAVSIADPSKPVVTNIPLVKSDAIREIAIGEDASVTFGDWDRESQIIGLAREFLHPGETLHGCLSSIFQSAIMAATLSPELAIAQLRWVGELADADKASRMMAAQARTELTTLVQQSGQTAPVPTGDFTVYAEAAAARITVMQAQWNSFQHLDSLAENDGDWLARAREAIELKANETDLCKRTRERAHLSYQRADEANGAALLQVRTLRLAFIKASNNFEAGIEIWKTQAETMEALMLVKNIFSFAVEAGKLASLSVSALAKDKTDPSDDKDKDDSSTDDDDGSTDEKAEKQKSMDTLEKAGKAISGTVGPVAEIIRNVRALMKIEDTAKALHKMASETMTSMNTALSKTITVGPLEGLDIVTGGAHVWDLFIAGMDVVFKTTQSSLAPISGSREFETAMRQMVIGARAVSNTRLALTQAENELVLAELHLASAKNAEEIVEKTFAEKKAHLQLIQDLKHQAFSRLLDTKRATLVELRHYWQAICYFSLAEERNLPDLPRMDEAVAEFVAAASLLSGYQLAIELLKPVPQAAHRVAISIPLTDANHQDANTLVFHVDTGHPDLVDFCRIRIDQMEIELFGDNDQRILSRKMTIQTDGTYQDRRVNGAVLSFSGEPWNQMIHYDASGNIDVSAGTYTRFAQLLFKPTPFTNWTLTLSKKDQAENVRRITLYISGEISPLSAAA
ncbi:hypothetical protein ACQ3G6_17250 [Allorhizobium undicola]|uniref:hypothetical protein n=1 Tax=Allorhizobium undicola TaxID=78527 RepID=UPI003D3518C4